jgi:hypothetical protein
MKTIKYALFFLTGLALASCSLFESLENKMYSDQTIELLTQGGKWKVDSMVHWKFTPQTGITDSLFLHYGTFEFQSPESANRHPYPGHGYLIHSYTKKGKARIDTMAWQPFGAASRAPDPEPLYAFSIWIENPTMQANNFSDDLEISYTFRMKEQNKVNFAGEAKLTQTGLTIAEWHYRYHLTR